MPARDIYHANVKNALIKDGWKITHDPLKLELGGKDMYVDLGAERLLAAEKGGEQIAVEIKSFVSNQFWRCDVEDNAYALMKDEKGRIAMFHSSATQWQHRFSLDVAMSKGYIELKGILSGTKSYGEEKLIIGRRNDLNTGTEKEEIITYLEDNSWSDEVNEFAGAVLTKADNLSETVEDAYQTMKLVYKIYGADAQWSERYNLNKQEMKL